MGLGKEKGSSRINRYEHQVTAIGFDNLDKLADVLGVPPAYLLADSPTMADVILALAKAKPRHQDQLMQVLDVLSGDPALTKVVLDFLAGSKPSSKALRASLQSLAKNSAVD